MYRTTHGMNGFGLSFEEGMAELQKAAEDPQAYATEKSGELIQKGQQEAAKVIEEKTGIPVTGGSQPTTQAPAQAPAQAQAQAPKRQIDLRKASQVLSRRTALLRGRSQASAQVPGAPAVPAAAPIMSDQPLLPPPVEEEKPFPWMYVGIGAGVLALGVAAWFFTRPKKAKPNKRGSKRKARSKAKANFRASKAGEGTIITIGRGKNARRWGHKTPPKKHRKKGATKPSQYAWSKGYKYPIYDAKHVRSALSYYPRFKTRYPDYVRQEIAKNLNAAREKYGISGARVTPNRKSR